MLALDFMLHGGGNFWVGLGERKGHAVGGHTEILTYRDGWIWDHQFAGEVLVLRARMRSKKFVIRRWLRVAAATSVQNDSLLRPDDRDHPSALN